MADSTTLDLGAYVTYKALLDGRSTYRIRHKDHFGGDTGVWGHTKRLYKHNLIRRDKHRVVPVPETPEAWADQDVPVSAIGIHNPHQLLKRRTRDNCIYSPGLTQAVGYLWALQQLAPLPPGRYLCHNYGLELIAYRFRLKLNYLHMNQHNPATLNIEAVRYWDGSFLIRDTPPGHRTSVSIDLANPADHTAALQACKQNCQTAYAEFLQMMNPATPAPQPPVELLD